MLAGRVVARIHGVEAAESAQAHFRSVVQRREVPADLPSVEIRLGDRGPLKLFEVLVEAGLASSKSEARRLVKQGAVSIERERVMDPMETLEVGEILIQVGKRRFARVKIST